MIEDEILTTEEVAQYLRVSARTVHDWAEKAEIPACIVGTAWRFKKSSIEKWLNARMAASHLVPPAEPLSIRSILAPERIHFLDYPSRRDVLLALAESLAYSPYVKDRQELALEILKREELMSTAIGRGIAIPHIRLSSVTDLVVAVGISRVDIDDFQPLDDEPVRLVLMIAAAYNQHAYYLQTLSFFSARLKNRQLRASLFAAQSSQEVYELLTGIGTGSV
jgi:PTS system nitrogen regulatory IIA component